MKPPALVLLIGVMCYSVALTYDVHVRGAVPLTDSLMTTESSVVITTTAERSPEAILQKYCITLPQSAR